MSTFWCQGQHIQSNGTFNAWLLDGTPKIEKHNASIHIREKLLMEQDMKEYWGFYLIKGSKVHLSYCARYPGSNIMLVSGAECLRVCAFLKEDEPEGKRMLGKLLNDPTGKSKSLQGNTSSDANEEPLNLSQISEAKTKQVLTEYKRILMDYFNEVKQHKRVTPTSTRKKALMMAKVLKQLSTPENSKETHGGETAEDRNGTYVDYGSEQVSSFSSSEEIILTCPCQGVKLYYPILPSRHCNSSSSKDKALFNDSANTIQYDVDEDSHYYFIFTNDNELYDNPVEFDLEVEKVRYKISTPIEVCKNVNACNFTLDFFSDEKVLLEMPYHANVSRFNETYQVHYTCAPRTPVYMFFYMLIPIIIIFVAFS